MSGNTFKAFCIFMQKGGVGKTTLTSMLSYELSKYGKTLVVDADQQGNLTFLFDKDFSSRKNQKGFLSVLKEEATIEEAAVEFRAPDEKSKGLYILGTKKNDNDLRYFMETSFRDDPHVIKILIESAKAAGFNYVFFDLPPSFGYYEKIILAYMDVILPIVEPEDFAVESLTNFNAQIRKLRVQYDSKVKECRYLLVNKGNSQKQVHKYFTDTLRSSSYEVFEFHDSKAISGAISYHIPMQEYQPGNPLCKTISTLADKVK